MSRENLLFSIIGILLGFIVGFIFANSINTSGNAPRTPAASTTRNASLPPDHPPLDSDAMANPQAMQVDVQRAIQQARSEPDNFAAQMKAAELYYRIQRYDDAIDFLTRANQLRPDDYEAIVNLGNTNFDAERYDAAERWYTIALEKKPDDVDVRTDLGLTFLFRNPPDTDRAIKEFRTSLQREPNHEQTLQNLVFALTRKGDVKEAQTTLEKLEKVNPDNRALSKLRSDLEALRTSSKSTGAAKKS